MAKQLIKGNEAIVKGAILAGCRFFFGYPITPASEIAEALKMSPTDVTAALRASSTHLSLDAPFNDDEENRLIDVLESEELPPPDDGLNDESLRIEIERALATLEKREAEVLSLYFGLGREHSLTLEEIGVKFNLTRERVRQIKEKAIRRLQHNSRSKVLRKYLG